MHLTKESEEYEVIFIGNSWAMLQQWSPNVTAYKYWELKLRIDTRIRADTGKINSSPVPQIAPITVISSGSTEVLQIISTDPDGDIVKCRWSEQHKEECGGIDRIVKIFLFI